MSLKLASNNEEVIDYLQFQIEGRQEISVILFSDTLEEFLDELKSYGRKLISFSCEIDSDSETYVITKYLNEVNKECLMIEPLYQFDSVTGEFEPIYIKDEFVLIEEYALYDEEEIYNVIKSSEYEVIGLTEHHLEMEEKECNCYQCENCASDCCNEEYTKDNTYDDEDFNEIEEFLIEKIDEYEETDISLLELLEEVYRVAYEDGYRSSLIGIGNAIDEALGN